MKGPYQGQFLRHTAAVMRVSPSWIPRWVQRNMEATGKAQRAAQTVADFDVWDDVTVHLSDRRVYGAVVAVEGDVLIVRQFHSDWKHRVRPDQLSAL